MKLVGKSQATVDAEALSSALKDEEAQLLAYLDASRYHLDIAQELGESIWPDVLAKRAEARKRISEIRYA